jgi:hypothetical protein
LRQRSAQFQHLTVRDAGAEQGELATANAGKRTVERRVFGFVCIQQVGDVQQ